MLRLDFAFARIVLGLAGLGVYCRHQSLGIAFLYMTLLCVVTGTLTLQYRLLVYRR